MVRDFLNVAEECLRVARIKVVFCGFQGLVIGSAERQDGRIAHCPQLRDDRSFICRRNGVPHDYQIELAFFTRFNGSGEANRRFNFKSLAGEHQLSGTQQRFVV